MDDNESGKEKLRHSGVSGTRSRPCRRSLLMDHNECKERETEALKCFGGFSKAMLKVTARFSFQSILRLRNIVLTALPILIALSVYF